MNEIKSIALYLPQFHPIPENDEWWGKGFTEWTNVVKAKPLYKNHFQPRLPADLGFYDLRVSESREAQAQLAREYGIYGFCYWHYWFAGRRMIERPFAEMIKSGKPDFPFCISWANQTWSGTWHGLSNKKILIEQTYPGKKDHEDHFYALLAAFHDKRYIEVAGKKLVFIFRPMDIPNTLEFTSLWQNLAVKENLNGFHFVGMQMSADWNPAAQGYNASVELGPLLHKIVDANNLNKITHRFLKKDVGDIKKKYFGIPKIVSYKNYVDQYPDHEIADHEYPMIYPGWDNTPRSGVDGWLFENSTPDLFKKLCVKAFAATENKKDEEKIVILKSWNEWAEGNYLEPDRKFGNQYLAAFKDALEVYKSASTYSS
ncbi:MAG TPA: glycoside hydrolase family 99-like domain-containing protein [Puia sp.]